MLNEDIEKQLQSFDAERFLRLQRYYNGQSDITQRTFNDTTKPNNKIVNNYAGYIVDIIQGYFIGKPVQYVCEDEAYMQIIQDVLDANEVRTLDMQIAKQVGIKGRCYEIVYVDENSEIQLAKVNAENIIPIYSNSIKPELVGVIRVWEENDDRQFEYYTDNEIMRGKITKEDKKLQIIDIQQHFFGQIPVIEYLNNDEALGDFEKVITLIDAYDKTRSDTANDFEYFTDAYMVLKGCDIDIEADADGIKSMRKNRLLTLPQDADASFLLKNINDVALENNNKRLREDIHKFSMTPDLTDTAFSGSISGIALQFKMFGLEQISQGKENFMRKGLNKRLELITRIINIKGGSYNSKDITMIFNRNMPVNVAETVATMISLRGILSDKTIISNLPFVDDPAYEMEQREIEESLSIDNYGEAKDEESGIGTEKQEAGQTTEE